MQIAICDDETYMIDLLSIEPTSLSNLHIQMMTIQILGIIRIMYAYPKLTDRFFLDTKLSMLTQQTRFQKQYVEEAQTRYRSTASLRHDMKNHIMIIKSLLEKDEFVKAKTYIEEMDIATDDISFPFQTNNPV